jgi:hypothetical protein
MRVAEKIELALRHAEGLMASVVQLLGCELAVPGHTTVSRRSARLESITREPLPRAVTEHPDRQQRVEGLRCRPVVERKASARQASMGEAALGLRRRQRADRGRHLDRARPQRRVSGRCAAGANPAIRTAAARLR